MYFQHSCSGKYKSAPKTPGVRKASKAPKAPKTPGIPKVS